MSNIVLNSPPICPQWTSVGIHMPHVRLHSGIARPVCILTTSTNTLGNKFIMPSTKVKLLKRGSSVKAFFFNPSDEPILKEALKEPVAFMGGIFAGLLRLDLNEEPLKEWVNRTVEASGITEQEIDNQGPNADDTAPEQIDIE
ncbi:hypothetical protein vseg_000800 [Gypsophila vaccaria]